MQNLGDERCFHRFVATFLGARCCLSFGLFCLVMVSLATISFVRRLASLRPKRVPLRVQLLIHLVLLQLLESSEVLLGVLLRVAMPPVFE